MYQATMHSCLKNNIDYLYYMIYYFYNYFYIFDITINVRMFL